MFWQTNYTTSGYVTWIFHSSWSFSGASPSHHHHHTLPSQVALPGEKGPMNTSPRSRSAVETETLIFILTTSWRNPRLEVAILMQQGVL